MYQNVTSGLSPESFSLTLADYYMNQAGIQEYFYVTLPNGTVLDDKSLLKESIFFVLSGMGDVNLLKQDLLMAAVKSL